MTDHTPSIEEIREDYISYHSEEPPSGEWLPGSPGVLLEKFDRAIAAHIADQIAEAWDAGAEMGHRLYAEPLRVAEARNPYREQDDA